MSRKQLKSAGTLLFIVLLLPSCAKNNAMVNIEEPVLQQAMNNENAKTLAFIKANFNQLRSEMAVGEGDTLVKLADLLGIQEAEKKQFYALTQSSFNQLFVSPETTAEQLLANIHKEVEKQ